MSIFKKIKNIFMDTSEKIEDSLSDYERDSKYAIKDAKSKVVEYKEKLSKLMAANRKLEHDIKNRESEISKWKDIAEKAAAQYKSTQEPKHADNAKQALENKNSALEMLHELQKNKKINDKYIQNSKNHIQKLESDIRKHEGKRQQLTVRNTSNEIRKSLQNVNTDSNPFASLEKLENEVTDDELQLDALDELSSNESDDLEKQYSTSTVDDELADLLK